MLIQQPTIDQAFKLAKSIEFIWPTVATKIFKRIKIAIDKHCPIVSLINDYSIALWELFDDNVIK